MPLTLRPNKAKAVLLAGAGWEAITLGSLKIDVLEVLPSPADIPEAEDYGFECTTASGEVTGRVSALLAIRE